MVIIERNNTLFGTLKAPTASTRSTESGNATGNSFASSLALQISALKAQSIDLLVNSAATHTGTAANTTLFDLLGNTTAVSGSNNALSALSPTGRNLSLADPESAYLMMSEINRRDALYKAQSSELSDMKAAIATLGQAGKQLSNSISDTSDDSTVRTQLQSFVGKYNDWIQEFQNTIDAGGILEGTQAAEISLYEFEQSIQNPFNGAALGLNGLKDLGITIDPTTHLATLNETQLNTVLSTSRQAALGTLKEFSARFSETAELLGSGSSFIAHQLDNLEHAFDYIGDNSASLQAEFGLGDPAKLSATLTKALASYNQTHTL